eukprot:UN28364
MNIDNSHFEKKTDHIQFFTVLLISVLLFTSKICQHRNCRWYALSLWHAS